MPQVSYAATASSLSIKSDYPNFFRTCYSDAKQAHAIAEFIKKVGWNQIAILNTLDSYGVLGANAVVSSVLKLGIKVFVYLFADLASLY